MRCRVFLEFCRFGIWLITACKNFLPQVKIPWDSLCCSFAPPEMLYFYLLQRTAFCRSVVEVSGELIGNVTVQCHQGTSSSESMSSEEVRNCFLLLGEHKNSAHSLSRRGRVYKCEGRLYNWLWSSETVNGNSGVFMYHLTSQCSHVVSGETETQGDMDFAHDSSHRYAPLPPP